MHHILEHMGYFLNAHTEHLLRFGQKNANIKIVLGDFEHIFLKFYLSDRCSSRFSHQERANLLTTVSHAFANSLHEIKKRGNKERRVAQLSNTLEKMVQQKKLPAGGIKELQGMLLKDNVDWITKLAILVLPDTPPDIINSFMGFILASLYTFKIQGRVKAFNEMSLGQLDVLVANGRVCLFVSLLYCIFFHLK